MIPSKLEYLLVLATLAIAGGSLFHQQLVLIIRKSEFWCAYLMFLAVATMIDCLAINLGWWSFTSAELCGILILGIPIEEFILFSVMLSSIAQNPRSKSPESHQNEHRQE